MNYTLFKDFSSSLFTISSFVGFTSSIYSRKSEIIPDGSLEIGGENGSKLCTSLTGTVV